jgi:gamma-glutamyltranspeptidase / glutathione hydrolase
MNPSLGYPPSNRPTTMGVNGMVASAHPLATLAGLSVLRAGGNAFDAIVATASTLNVVEPYMSGVGGIGTALVNIAAEGRVRALDFSGRAPLAAEPSVFTDDTKDDGIMAAMVPGNLAGWLTMHEAYGSMDLDRLLQPAIDYAQNGFPVTHFNSRMIDGSAHLLTKFPASAGIVLGNGSRAPAPGARLRMPQLAATLRRIAAGGLDEFYRGALAREIVEGNKELGGLYTEEDLATYQPRWLEPISVNYKGYEVFTAPPNCSAFQVLQTLKLLETFDDSDRVFQQPDTLHMFMEAVKLAVTDRIKYAGDPDYVSAPLDALLSDGYAKQQAALIDRDVPAIVSGERYAEERPDGALKPGSPEAFDGGMTTHFAVADRDGNVVSVTQTLGGGFGSGAAVGNTGVFLNNMASYFELEEGSPNRIGPGKRVDFVVAPTQTFRDGKFHLSIGTPGSWGILQTTPQFLTNVLDYGMTPQQAIEAPRFRYFEGRRVQMEDRFPLHVRRALEARGHEIDLLESWSTAVGGAQGIQLDPNEGTFQGGADPRRDGFALGY